MKNIYPAFLLLAVLSVSQGCSDDPAHEDLSKALHLEGTIGTSTRAVINSGYEKDLDVCFARSDQGSLWHQLSAVRIGGIGRTPIVFTEPQFYPDDDREVRLNGYYPGFGWTGNVQEQPIYTITDGSTDLMATGLLSGSYSKPVTTCMFRHLLTQLKFVCFSDQPDMWGAITKIEVQDIHRQQTFTLSDKIPVLSPVESSATFSLSSICTSEDKRLELYSGSPGSLPESLVVQDSILVPTQEAGTERYPLILHITTQKGGIGIEKPGGYQHTAALVVKNADTGESGVQAGFSHRVEMSFTNSEIEIVAVSVEPWTAVEIDEPIPL